MDGWTDGRMDGWLVGWLDEGLDAGRIDVQLVTDPLTKHPRGRGILSHFAIPQVASLPQHERRALGDITLLYSCERLAPEPVVCGASWAYRNKVGVGGGESACPLLCCMSRAEREEETDREDEEIEEREASDTEAIRMQYFREEGRLCQRQSSNRTYCCMRRDIRGDLGARQK